MHTSCLFTTLAVDGVSGERHAPAALYPRRKDPRYPLDRRLDGPQSRSGHRDQRKNSLCLRRGSNFDLPVVQSVDRHYTDRATPAHIFISAGMIFKNKKFRYGIPAHFEHCERYFRNMKAIHTRLLTDITLISHNNRHDDSMLGRRGVECYSVS
jgi:hypothetical protein